MSVVTLVFTVVIHKFKLELSSSRIRECTRSECIRSSRRDGSRSLTSDLSHSRAVAVEHACSHDPLDLNKMSELRHRHEYTISTVL